MKYDRIFTPLKINKLEIKNRVVMPAMNTLYTPDGYATDRFNWYFWKRAEGGCGLLTVGGAVIDDYGSTYSMMHLDDDKYIPGYLEFTKGCHERGAMVSVQLFQAGRYGYSSANGGRQPMAPSPLYSGYSHETPREMTKEDIKSTIEHAAAAAVRAQKAGFDMVELSGSAGYLVSQFISPYTNRRMDEYGGSWENRLRFPRELVAGVRKAVGPDYPIAMRIAGHDLVPGSNTNEDAVRFAAAMEKAGIDFISVTGGWHESKVPQITGDLPRGGWDFLVAAIKKAVSIPVACSNRINDPEVAERLLATGVCDMVSLGRPLIADPDWCNKAENGEADTIRHCLGCNQGCLARVFFGKPAECLVNGQVGREYYVKDMKPAEKKQNVLVIGGGVVGCEYAVRAAQQGHTVTLWEMTDRLGGQVHLAAMPPHKYELLTLVQYHEAMLKKLGVTVVFNKEATLADVKAGNFDQVVTAMGRGDAPKIPLVNKDNVPVYDVNDILGKKAIAGKNVLVIGGGTVGCETAEYLACEAATSEAQIYHMMAHKYEKPERVYELLDTCNRSITVIDMFKIGKGFDAGTAWPVMKNLDRWGVKRLPFTSLVEISDGVAVLDVKKAQDAETAKRVTVPCDSVVLCVGAKPKDGLFNELKDAGVNVINVGDSFKVTNIITGIQQVCHTIEEQAGVVAPEN